jgi:hypothetical protein
MKIAVIGGGIFGICSAVKLGQCGHNVTLFEKYDNILKASSGINQYRLHRGYHYPRSKNTAISAMESEKLFQHEFKEAIVDKYDHYYGIAKKNSLTSSEEFKLFCNEIKLEYTVTDLDLVNKNNIDLCVKVKEKLFDPCKLKELCWNKLKKSKVNVVTNKQVKLSDVKNYDHVVISAYANQNFVLSEFPEYQNEYQFELCEKPVIEVPNSLKGKSIVIMDGPFMCIDPFGNTEFSIMGNVVHAIHQKNIGKYPIIEKKFIPLINQGIIKNPPITNFDLFVKSAANFIPDIEKVKHIGSMYTVRTVLPHVEKTDERPTIVSKINKRITTIFSGKIGNSIQAANQVSKIINEASSIK